MKRSKVNFLKYSFHQFLRVNQIFFLLSTYLYLTVNSLDLNVSISFPLYNVNGITVLKLF